AGTSSEDYVIGQVVNSLFQKKSATCRAHPLAHLFKASESETQPVFVAVPRVSNFYFLSLSLSLSECALERADEKEEKRRLKVKQKLRNRTSQAVTKSLASSANEIDVKQCKKKSQINEAEEMLKNQRTVFVGNLPISCTVQVPAEDTLSKKLAAIKHKIHPNMKYINAYVVFKEEGAATKALKRNGTQIANGFHIRVDLASKATSHDNKRSIFVGNLSYEIEDDTVREHFSECGNVVAVRLVRDKNTGIGKGFGYVLFENTDAVHLALKLNNSELKGRKLRVKRCVEKGKNKNSSDNVRDSGPKHRFGTSLKNTEKYTNSFAGEKATPLKKKTKRPKSVTRTKGGKRT
uniref:RNA binding motif protein 34 n=1 Tax=Chelonoidis abingdonii TaxID=106734 RepID=A0A8C0QLJ8_CHEAB